MRETGASSSVQTISLKAIIDQEERKHPGFRLGVEAVAQRRRILHQLGVLRESLGLQQLKIAEKIGTQQPAIARMESGDIDPRLSTILRYIEAIGYELKLVPKSKRSKKL